MWEAQHEDILERLGEENARIVQKALRTLIELKSACN